MVPTVSQSTSSAHTYQGSQGPGGKGTPEKVKIHWGPCEILPEGPVDLPKLENW